MNENSNKGTWEKRYRYVNLWNFRCSECMMTCPHSAKETPTYEFCPHCGKQMKIEGEE
jgi:rRNA maturation endonuclease Nob1